MTFVLLGSKAVLVHLRQAERGVKPEVPAESDEILNQDVSVKFDHGFSTDGSNRFMVRFQISMTIHKKPKTLLDVEFISEFKATEPLTEDDKKSHYVTRNAPAIAFPFLRSYVAHITLLAGYGSVMMAPINFAKDFPVEPAEMPSDVTL